MSPPRRISLIDGAFFKGVCHEYGREIDFDIFSNLDWNRVTSGSARGFYYDSLPAKKKNQSENAYQEELSSKIDELNLIRRQDNFHVKDGISKYRNKDKIREQKGVDILLAIDAVRMAFQGLAEEVVIFTSDTDFFPVFELMSQTSCKGVLRHQTGRTSEELIYTADVATPLNLSEMLAWCGCGPGSLGPYFPDFNKAQSVIGETLLEEEGYHGQSVKITYVESSRTFNVYHFSSDQGVRSVETIYPLLALERARSFSVDVSYNQLKLLKKASG